MRIETLVVIALLSLPSGLTAQGVRPPPRTGRGVSPQPASLPPEAPPVSRALAYKRSRWSAEAYSLISAFQVPTTGGAVTRYTTVGAGTRADYRYSDSFSATVDLTASIPGGPVTTETAEVGTRFSPLPWDRTLRPFVDVRAAYARMSDIFATPAEASFGTGGPSQQFAAVGRYSRGFGTVAGTGVEYSLTHTLALTTEVSAMRNRMTAYRLTGPAGLPSGTTYWMTSLRYTLGLKFNPARALH